MKKILLSVEGQTEESFVKQLLQPLFGTECFLQPVVLTTSRSPQGKAYKGGGGTYAKIRDEVQRLCRDTSAVVITTMYDFYGLLVDHSVFMGYHLSATLCTEEPYYGQTKTLCRPTER
jgi:hypothetical protein